MAAIGIYSLHNVQDVEFLAWLDSKRSIFRPYALATSQWQRWNLFSPDPLRRITEMEFEAQLQGEWVTVRMLDDEHTGFFNRAPELKIMRRMEDNNRLKERYIYVLCDDENLPPGTPVRLRQRTTVVPQNHRTQSAEWWNEWQPEWRETVDVDITCPA